MFEPFYSTKPADSGTGLGLAVVHDLVVRAGGHIQVHSEPGVGTRFRIALPCAGAAAGVAGVAAAQPDGSKM
ncbi:ATP-binding protein [Xanthomonas graminis]|uniref:ATP-binding protein n=1 Tax=Xanthomonas graminis TaxID=3390026 RepID=UPI001F38CD21|nr:ATP-binding protein [Xanthomonas translucens]